MKNRRSDAADVRIDLQHALEEPAAPQPAATARGGRLSWVVATAALLLAVAFAVPAMRYLRETPSPEMRIEINTPATTDPFSFSISPDGRQIVFVASDGGVSRLLRRSLAAVAAQPLPGTEGATYPFWSPDSTSIGFFAEGKLKRVDLAGGRAEGPRQRRSGTRRCVEPAGVDCIRAGRVRDHFSRFPRRAANRRP